MSDELHPSDLELSVEPETGIGQLRLDLTRRVAAEAFSAAMLIVAVIGSGIMRLFYPHNHSESLQ